MKTLIQAAIVGAAIFTTTAFAGPDHSLIPSMNSVESNLAVDVRTTHSSERFSGIYTTALSSNSTEYHFGSDGKTVAESNFCLPSGISVALMDHPLEGHAADRKC